MNVKLYILPPVTVFIIQDNKQTLYVHLVILVITSCLWYQINTQNIINIIGEKVALCNLIIKINH